MARPRDSEGEIVRPEDVLDDEELQGYYHGTPVRARTVDPEVEQAVKAQLVEVQKRVREAREGTS